MFKKNLKALIIFALLSHSLTPVISLNAQTSEDDLEIHYLEPNEGLQGAWISLTVVGSGFDEQTRISLNRGTINVNANIENVSPTRIEINFLIPYRDQDIGYYNVTAWNYDGDEFTLIDGFNAIGSEDDLEIHYVEPSEGKQGETIRFSIFGSGFDGSTQFGMRHETFSVTLYVENRSTTRIDVNCTIPINDEYLGYYDITAWSSFSPERAILYNDFRVNEPTKPDIISSEELRVYSVEPSIIERGSETWITLRGTGFVNEEDGFERDADNPYTTLVVTPQFLIWQTPRYEMYEIYNSTYMKILLKVYPDFPPQNVVLRLFNPARNSLSPDTLEPILYDEQRDLKQKAGFDLTIVRGSQEQESSSSEPVVEDELEDDSDFIPGFPFYSIIIGISVFVLLVFTRTRSFNRDRKKSRAWSKSSVDV